MIEKIVSGGQTGVDQAGLLIATESASSLGGGRSPYPGFSSTHLKSVVLYRSLRMVLFKSKRPCCIISVTLFH